MFSQKKKNSKGWLLLIPLCLIFVAGIWMNIDRNDSTPVNSDDGTSVSSEYDDEQKDNDNDIDTKTGSGAIDSNVDENPDNSYTDDTYNENGNEYIRDYYLAISDDGVVVVREFKDGILESEIYTEISVDSLPPYDRDALERGMVMLTQDEVDSLMESFEG